MGLTYLFISHDMAVVRHISDTIAVMYLGQMVEIGNSEGVCANPRHPYTKALIASVPVLDPSRRDNAAPLAGEMPSRISVSGG